MQRGRIAVIHAEGVTPFESFWALSQTERNAGTLSTGYERKLRQDWTIARVRDILFL
jgi:hypothetical protein